MTRPGSQVVRQFLAKPTARRRFGEPWAIERGANFADSKRQGTNLGGMSFGAVQLSCSVCATIARLFLACAVIEIVSQRLCRLTQLRECDRRVPLRDTAFSSALRWGSEDAALQGLRRPTLTFYVLQSGCRSPSVWRPDCRLTTCVAESGLEQHGRRHAAARSWPVAAGRASTSGIAWAWRLPGHLAR